MSEKRTGAQRLPDSPAQPSRRLIRSRTVAELKCFLCGRLAGLVESCRDPLVSQVLVRIPGQVEVTPVADWRRMRCLTCGARVYPDDIRTIVERIEPPAEQVWASERRERSPRKLAGGKPEMRA